MRVVEHRDWQIDVDDRLAEVDRRTRLVVTSHVSYLYGARLDYKLLYERLRGTNALLLLDATQSLGAIPVDMNHADFVVSSSYKWLFSTHGAGILAVNPTQSKQIPASAGWRSVSNLFSNNRFEQIQF